MTVVVFAQIARGVSSKNRASILARARQLDIKVLNRAARVSTEESE